MFISVMDAKWEDNENNYIATDWSRFRNYFTQNMNTLKDKIIKKNINWTEASCHYIAFDNSVSYIVFIPIRPF